jgi:hypothetical protein
MRTAPTKDVHLAIQASELLKRTELRERGWTSTMIARLLPEPDAVLPNPRYRSAAPMRLYRRERVELVEATAEFTRLRETGARRAARSKASAARRAVELVGSARAYRPELPTTLKYERLLKRAVDHYNVANLHRGDYADHTSSPEFLARTAWNFFRHHLTDWDATWERLAGKPGVRDAYIAAAESLTAHVCARFPVLREAASAWMQRKRHDAGG